MPNARLPPFQRFLDAHSDAVLRYLISALRAYPRLLPDSNLRGWVLTIAHRKALDVHRARGRNPVPVAEIHEPACAPADESDEPGHWARVRALPPRQREVLTLRYAADLTHGEIAAALGCSEEAARRAAADGLKTLRKELRDVPATA